MNHLNSNVLTGLAVATVLAITAAVMLVHNRQPQNPSETANYALPGLRDHLNDVKSLAIIGADNQTLVTLSNSDQGWTVQEKSTFWADTGKLRDILLKLADARLIEAKTANEQKYADLGVTAIEQKNAKGLLIKLEGIDNPAQLIIGNPSSHGNGSFVRHPNEKQSWLTQVQLTIEKDPAIWLDIALTDINSERIAEIVIENGKKGSLRLFREQSADANFQVANVPKGREVADPGTVNALASTLSGLNLEDVSEAKANPNPSINASYRTFEGLIIDVSAWQQDDKHYVRLKVKLDEAWLEKAIQYEIDRAKKEYEALMKDFKEASAKKDGSSVKSMKEPAKPEALADSAKFRKQRIDDINKEIAQLNQRFQDRQFVIPSSKYANLDKTLDDLLKAKPQRK